MKKRFNFKTGFGYFGNHLFQAFLIVFSVLFALFINKYTEDLQLKKQKKLALQSISNEMKNNQLILHEWYSKHEQAEKRLDSLLLLPEEELIRICFNNEKGGFDFSVITGKSNFVNSIMTSTAWETARTTGIINEFDFKHIEILTQTYELQHFLTYSSLNAFLEVMKDRKTYNPEEISTTLLLFKWAIKEMVGQEVLLGEVYEVLLDQLNQ